MDHDKEIVEIILLNIKDKDRQKMLYGLKASIIVANKYMTRKECFQYIVNYAMYTPFKMTKEEGQQKKEEFTQNVLDNDYIIHTAPPCGSWCSGTAPARSADDNDN